MIMSDVPALVRSEVGPSLWSKFRYVVLAYPITPPAGPLAFVLSEGQREQENL